MKTLLTSIFSPTAAIRCDEENRLKDQDVTVSYAVTQAYLVSTTSCRDCQEEVYANYMIVQLLGTLCWYYKLHLDDLSSYVICIGPPTYNNCSPGWVAG